MPSMTHSFFDDDDSDLEATPDNDTEQAGLLTRWISQKKKSQSQAATYTVSISSGMTKSVGKRNLRGVGIDWDQDLVRLDTGANSNSVTRRDKEIVHRDDKAGRHGESDWTVWFCGCC